MKYNFIFIGCGYREKCSIIHIGSENVKMSSIWGGKYGNIYKRSTYYLLLNTSIPRNLFIIEIKVQILLINIKVQICIKQFVNDTLYFYRTLQFVNRFQFKKSHLIPIITPVSQTAEAKALPTLTYLVAVVAVKKIF